MIAYLHQGRLYYFCPGCRHTHSIQVDGQGDPGKNWQWDGNLEQPTISPSVREFIPAHEYEGKVFPEKTTCHHFVKAGVIELLEDSSSHQVRGKHPLPPIPDDYGLPGRPA